MGRRNKPREDVDKFAHMVAGELKKQRQQQQQEDEWFSEGQTPSDGVSVVTDEEIGVAVASLGSDNNEETVAKPATKEDVMGTKEDGLLPNNVDYGTLETLAGVRPTVPETKPAAKQATTIETKAEGKEPKVVVDPEVGSMSEATVVASAWGKAIEGSSLPPVDQRRTVLPTGETQLVGMSDLEAAAKGRRGKLAVLVAAVVGVMVIVVIAMIVRGAGENPKLPMTPVAGAVNPATTESTAPAKPVAPATAQAVAPAEPESAEAKAMLAAASNSIVSEPAEEELPLTGDDDGRYAQEEAVGAASTKVADAVETAADQSALPSAASEAEVSAFLSDIASAQECVEAMKQVPVGDSAEEYLVALEREGAVCCRNLQYSLGGAQATQCVVQTRHLVSAVRAQQ